MNCFLFIQGKKLKHNHFMFSFFNKVEIKKKQFIRLVLCLKWYKVTSQTILCTDGHVSYKGFAKEKMLEHHPLRADLKQFVKKEIYHIQHVNSTHNRLKKWIDNTFWGVSTKYLQQYLNWYKIKETIKYNKFIIKSFAEKTVENRNVLLKYKNIQIEYEKLLSTQI